MTMKDLDALELEMKKQLCNVERNIYLAEGRYMKETANLGKCPLLTHLYQETSLKAGMRRARPAERQLEQPMRQIYKVIRKWTEILCLNDSSPLEMQLNSKMTKSAKVRAI